jgi:formate dehydrogenase accessory protein FdhD
MRHLPRVQPLRVEINGVLAGSPRMVPDATAEFAVGWAFLHRFFEVPGQLGKVTPGAHQISLMVESGVDLDRRKAEAAGWVAPADPVADIDLSVRPPRAVAVMTELDAIATCQRSFEKFEQDGARAGYIHAALSTADDVLCLARDVATPPAACKVLGWAVSGTIDCGSTILVVRGMVDHLVVDAAARAGIPVVATDAVPTTGAITAGEASCTTILGLCLSHRRGLFVDGGHLGDGFEPVDHD